MRAQAFVLLAALVAAACSSDTQPPLGGGTGATGGQSQPTAGAAGAGTGGSAAGSGAGSAGTPSASGAAGMAGTSGSAGAAGTAGSGAGGTGSLTMGTQTDPGTEGDGTFPQPPPYTQPPESLSLMNGATKGTVTGPFLHTQTGTYTGWSQWKFTYYVYVPSQYQPGHAAALMVFNDGYLYAGVPGLKDDSPFNAPTVFDNLIHEGAMPVTIAVFIFPGTNDGHMVGGGDGGRSTQYDTANDQYGKFLRDEFLPATILNKYDIVTDADGWAIGGHSSGGIASIIAGWYHSDRFHKMLTASPSFPNKGGKFPDEFNTSPTPKPLRIYHLAGTKDLGRLQGRQRRGRRDPRRARLPLPLPPRRRSALPAQGRYRRLPSGPALAVARLQSRPLKPARFRAASTLAAQLGGVAPNETRPPPYTGAPPRYVGVLTPSLRFVHVFKTLPNT